MKPLKWPTNEKASAEMRERKYQNIAKSLFNPNENRVAKKLEHTGFKWTRQAVWGKRIFDFWCAKLGVAVEVDGPEHVKPVDAYRDEYNFRRSGIIVLRVRNNNESDLVTALALIAQCGRWKERREKLGVDKGSKMQRRFLANLPYPPSLLAEYLATGNITVPDRNRKL